MRITFSDTFFFVLSRNYIYENFSYITRTRGLQPPKILNSDKTIFLHYAHARELQLFRLTVDIRNIFPYITRARVATSRISR